jgi:hypothetical protein
MTTLSLGLPEGPSHPLALSMDQTCSEPLVDCTAVRALSAYPLKDGGVRAALARR